MRIFLLLLIATSLFCETTGSGASTHAKHPNIWVELTDDDWPSGNGDDHRTFSFDGALGNDETRIGFGYDMLTKTDSDCRLDQLTLSISNKWAEDNWVGLGLRYSGSIAGEDIQNFWHSTINQNQLDVQYEDIHRLEPFLIQSYESVKNIEGFDISTRATVMVSPYTIEAYANVLLCWKQDDRFNYQWWWIGPAYLFEKQINDKRETIEYTYDREDGPQLLFGVTLEKLYFTVSLQQYGLYGGFGIDF
jgi:hypothetical protein